MNGEMKEIIRPFKYLLIIFIVEVLLCFIFFTSYTANYDRNVFEIRLNDKLMECYYTEKYNQTFLVSAGTSSYNNVDNYVNEIELSDKINLEILEYEERYKDGTRRKINQGWIKSDKYNYILVNNDNIKIQIKRMNKVLYDGDYIKDLSNYINEKGRYYIHIYSTRKDGLFTSVKTHISFNVIVGGGNYD